MCAEPNAAAICRYVRKRLLESVLTDPRLQTEEVVGVDIVLVDIGEGHVQAV